MTKNIPQDAICVPLQMRWSDMDAYEHANNAIYLRYIEEARFRWRDGLVAGVEGTLEQFLAEDAVILAASHRIEYVQQLKYEAVKGQLNVHFWNTKLGNSSITSAALITDPSNTEIFAKALTTLVQFNTQTQRPEPLTAQMREYLSTHMGDEPQFHG